MDITIHFIKKNGEKTNETFDTFGNATDRLLKDDIDCKCDVMIVIDYNANLYAQKKTYNDALSFLFENARGCN